MDRLSDRLAIIEIVNRFGIHADWREWDKLRMLFKDEVVSDYSALYGEKQQIKADDLIEQWKGFLGSMEATQHMITNHVIDLNGDRATCRAHFRAQHILANRNGGDRWMPSGTYLFELEKIGDDWKIERITLKMLWAQGNQNLLSLANEKS